MPEQPPTPSLKALPRQRNCSLAESVASLSEAQRREVLSSLTEQQATDLLYDWRGFWARPNQLQPGTPGATIQRTDWTYWLVQAGRGFGKTRVGAETVREWVDAGYKRIHLVGATAADTRDVMIQGESGLLNCFPPSRRPLYEPSKRLITFDTGAVAIAFSADEPERLRGPQCEAGWLDEIASWRFPDAWDNFLFGLRLGNDPKAIITSTPKPIDLVRGIIKDPQTVVTRGSSYDNRANLAPAFFASIIRKYEGTRLGRQELNAELLEDVPGALWSQRMIDATRWSSIPSDLIIRIVVSIDPAVSVGEDSADTGIVVAALLRTGHVLVLDDLTCHESPMGWGKIACAAYRSRRADRIVGEINNGGDLVEANIRAVDANVPFRAVRASRGKAIRAEPVAALYEQGRVHHVGNFADLETQMTSFVPAAERDTKHRLDRMDALVWAVTELVIDVEQVQTTRSMAQVVRISPY
jgi:phage terminase large subunit-like protein